MQKHSYGSLTLIDIQHRLVKMMSFHPVLSPLLYIFGEKVSDNELRRTRSGHLVVTCGNGRRISFDVTTDNEDDGPEEPYEESWGYYVPIDNLSFDFGEIDSSPRIHPSNLASNISYPLSMDGR